MSDELVGPGVVRGTQRRPAGDEVNDQDVPLAGAGRG